MDLFEAKMSGSGNGNWKCETVRIFTIDRNKNDMISIAKFLDITLDNIHSIQIYHNKYILVHYKWFLWFTKRYRYDYDAKIEEII